MSILAYLLATCSNASRTLPSSFCERNDADSNLAVHMTVSRGVRMEIEFSPQNSVGVYAYIYICACNTCMYDMNMYVRVDRA